MEHEIIFTFSQLTDFVLKLLAVIVSLGGASAVICKVVATLKKPNAKQDKRIDILEKKVEKHDLILADDGSKLDRLEEGSRITQQALLALLDHSLDGNNIKQLTDAKEALRKHLIEK